MYVKRIDFQGAGWQGLATCLSDSVSVADPGNYLIINARSPRLINEMKI